MSVKINYETARFGRRCFANLLDFIFFGLTFMGLFLSARAIASASPGFAQPMAELETIRVESGLYHKNLMDGRVQDIVTYTRNANGNNGYSKWSESRQAIKTFIVYLGNHGRVGAQERVQQAYDVYRLSLNYGVPFVAFAEVDGVVEETQALKDAVTLTNRFENIYAPFIDNKLQAYLITEIPRYKELTQFASNVLFFGEIIPSYCLAGLLIYLLPTFIFRRGRMTFGKRLYKIGLVDRRLLVPKMGRSLARFSIFYFGELLLSLATFGIPFIISFSLMAFGKKRQGFPDYMLGLHEVDLSKEKIYFDKAEIRMEDISGHKKAVDFKVERID